MIVVCLSTVTNLVTIECPTVLSLNWLNVRPRVEFDWHVLDRVGDHR